MKKHFDLAQESGGWILVSFWEVLRSGSPPKDAAAVRPRAALRVELARGVLPGLRAALPPRGLHGRIHVLALHGRLDPCISGAGRPRR